MIIVVFGYTENLGGEMVTVCAVETEERLLIERAVKSFDPDGTFIAVYGTEDLEKRIADAGPHVVWLEADAENFTLAAKLKDAADINYIFIADDTANAFDALRVKASGYILRPVTEESAAAELTQLRFPVNPSEKQIKIQCFGNFEVFSHGHIMKFSRSLSKEALAYLIDRRGAGCSVREICSVLWEDRPADTNLKSQCRVILSGLKKDMENEGAGEVLYKSWNVWGVNMDKVSCDYYDYLRDRSRYADSFMGEYMMQYSWAELTRGSLFHMSENTDL